MILWISFPEALFAHLLCRQHDIFDLENPPMSLHMVVKQEDDITVIHASGRITLGEGSVILGNTVRDILNKGFRKLVIDLSDVTYIDSSGLGVGTGLVACYVWTRNLGGELVLVNPTKKVRDLMQITKIYTIYNIFPDVASAVEHFKEPPPPKR